MADLRCAAQKCGRGFSLVCLTIFSGILAPLLFIAVTVAIGSAQPGYNPVRESVSHLVLGVHGWLQTLSFFVFGFLFSIFSIRLYQATFRTSVARLGVILLLASCLGFILIGAFPVELKGETARTVSGMIHSGIASLATVTFILGCTIFTIYFGTDSRWRRYRWFTLVVVVFCLGFSLIWKFGPDSWPWKGLAERLMLLSGLLWIEVISLRLLRFCIGKT